MAAPLQFARKRLALIQVNSTNFDIFKVFCLRIYSHSSKIKRQQKRKQMRNDFDLNIDEFFGKQNRTQAGGREKGAIHDGHSHGNHGPRPSPHGKRKEVSSNRTDCFNEILASRRNEALKSILVRSGNPQSTLLKLQSYGPLEYAGFTSLEKTYILAQYKDMRDLNSLMQGSSTFGALNQFPMRSRCLLDNPRGFVGKKKKSSELGTIQLYPEDRTSGSYPLKESFDAEVLALHACKSLKELDIRQRFFVCSLLEDVLRSLLPDTQITPYGSCLNGFGWWDGDLDMMLSFHGYSMAKDSRLGVNETPFKFLTEVFSTERHMSQRTLSAMAGIIEVMPRITRVIKILNARVPIIRFRHAAIELQCDLSLEALDSIKMTEILYLLSMADPRVKPLMTTVKQWAIHHKLTSGGEQQKATTLGLLCLLIFYLQTCHPAILPSLRQLQALADTGHRFVIDGTYYCLPVSPQSIPPSENKESIENLLYGFFSFYASFNFENHAISIIEGSTFSKSDRTSAVFVENPLCIGLNICRNISKNSLEQLQRGMKISAQVMNEMTKNKSPSVARLWNLFEQPLDDSVRLNIDTLFMDEGTNEQMGEGMSENSSILEGEDALEKHEGNNVSQDLFGEEKFEGIKNVLGSERDIDCSTVK